GFNRDGLVTLLKKHNAQLSFLHPLGRHLIESVPICLVSTEKGAADEDLKKDLLLHIFLTKEESIDDNFTYGLRQLTEVALRALSPGVNDPGTAINSLHALADLLAFRLTHHPSNTISDDKGILRITTAEPTIEQVIGHVLLPIWDYGKKDRLVQQEMQQILLQLQAVSPHPAISKLMVSVHRHQAANET
ncbi:MAG TPA: DUF2254 family protein, partial [Flavisolibacter sp.]